MASSFGSLYSTLAHEGPPHLQLLRRLRLLGLPANGSGSSAMLLPAAAARQRATGVPGRHARLTTWTSIPQVCMQRPELASHRRKVLTSEPDANHWPEGSGAMQRQANQAARHTLS